MELKNEGKITMMETAETKEVSKKAKKQRKRWSEKTKKEKAITVAGGIAVVVGSGALIILGGPKIARLFKGGTKAAEVVEKVAEVAEPVAEVVTAAV